MSAISLELNEHISSSGVSSGVRNRIDSSADLFVPIMYLPK